MFLMRVLDQLNQEMKEAMRAKERDRLTTIRMIKSAIQNEEIDKGRELDEDEEIAILSREKKQRLESYEEFEKAGRTDLLEKLDKEIAIVDKYLPEQLSDEEVRDIVNETIDEVGAESMQDMGDVMSNVMPKVQGKADGGQVNALVREILSSK
jgi:hypothetical protein